MGIIGKVGGERLAAMRQIDAGDDGASIEVSARRARDVRVRIDSVLAASSASSRRPDVAAVDSAPAVTVSPHTTTAQVAGPDASTVHSDIRSGVGAVLLVLSARVRTGHERRIKDDPTISGRLVLEIDLEGGRVADAVASGAIPDVSRIGCAERAARRWQVPGVDGQTLTLPFALTAVD